MSFRTGGWVTASRADAHADLPATGEYGQVAWCLEHSKWAVWTGTAWSETWLDTGGVHPDLATHDTLGLATQAEVDSHAGAADPHTVYRLESAAITDADVAAANKDGAAGTASMRTIGAGAQQSAAGNHTHGGASISTLKTTADQIINGTAFQNITDLTFPVSANTDYAFDFYITFRSTTATGFRFSVNGPAGTVDYMRKYQTIANSDLVGVATWLEGHAVTFDSMTVTAATITAGVDLHCRITGRFKCGGSGGTFAARVASETANNDLVVQKGSWGMWF